MRMSAQLRCELRTSATQVMSDTREPKLQGWKRYPSAFSPPQRSPSLAFCFSQGSPIERLFTAETPRC